MNPGQLLRDPRSIPAGELQGMSRIAVVAARNIYWGRTHGWANLLEEHDLNLVERIPRDMRKWAWRRRHASDLMPAIPVFLCGAQRSGTNMVTHGLSRSPEFRVYNEGNRRAFNNYRLLDLDRIEELTEESGHRFVLFKPLTDSHRLPEILDGLSSGSTPKAIWVYREVAGRTRSALAKFGDSNARVLRRQALDPAFSHWQLGENRPSETLMMVLRDFEMESLSPADGSALFWLIRNSLFFELNLHERDDVLLVSYERFVASPEPAMRSICDFLDLQYQTGLIGHVELRRPPVVDAGISPRVQELCASLSERLDAYLEDQRALSA